MTTTEFNNKVLDFSNLLKPAAINLTRDLETAKDLIQETVYKALSNREKFKDGTNLKAWIFTIMRNIFINDYRRKRKRSTILDSTENSYFINIVAHEIPNEGEADTYMNDISKALSQVNEIFRLPFIMHFEGFKYEEIAEELQIPVGTVKSRIHIARKSLKKQLFDYRYYNEN